MTHTQRSDGDSIEETRIQAGGCEARLLTQLAQLPPDGELEDSVWALLTAFGTPEDGLLVGVCVGQVRGQELVVRRAKDAAPRGYDAVRLFPSAAYEHVVDLPFDQGSTLHVASDTPLDGGLLHETEQLALAVGSVVRRHRYVETLQAEAVEARSLRDQAVQSDKLAGLGRMAASIVHELNNPLTSIMAYADYLRKRFELNGAAGEDQERLGRISEAAARVLSYSRDLIAYSRPSVAQPASIALHEVIERALTFCDHQIQETDVRIVRDFGQIPPVFGLQGPLTQVFVNLFTNACQALEARGGTITIRTRVSPTSEHVIVDVSDDGPGIQSDIIDQLFDPYVTTRAEGGGSGLGLNIVQTIVASHGGKVEAQNAQAGAGAVFTIELPCRPVR